MSNTKNTANAPVEKIQSGTTNVIIIREGEQHEIEVDYKGIILEAAIDADLDPPYSCMSAACTTCMAKLKQGEVHMDEFDVLTDEEIADGYILTCQSHPRSHGIIIDYED